MSDCLSLMSARGEVTALTQHVFTRRPRQPFWRRITITNTLYFGDNLHVLREHIADESVDLIYLDPPFNSNANYNIVFNSPPAIPSVARIAAPHRVAPCGHAAFVFGSFTFIRGHVLRVGCLRIPAA